MSEQKSEGVRIPFSEEAEQRVREYFENRPGWSVTRLDTGEARAADYRVCYPDNCFLCEVKAVESVHADIPYAPVAEFALEWRHDFLSQIEEWKRSQPNAQIILAGETRALTDEDDATFRERFRLRRRNTESEFNGFRVAMMEYFANSDVGHLPYVVRLDSEDLYVPSLEEREKFFNWLAGELRAFAEGRPGEAWDQVPDPRLPRYNATYTIHFPKQQGDSAFRYNLLLYRKKSGGLKLAIHGQGTLNLDAISRNVNGRQQQLEASAAREGNRSIARIIALTFASGVGSDWKLLLFHIHRLLAANPRLSAIAILARIRNADCFLVCHNHGLQETEPLDRGVFDDGRSLQLGG